MDDMGSGIATIRPQSLVNLMKVCALVQTCTAGCIGNSEAGPPEAVGPPSGQHLFINKLC